MRGATLSVILLALAGGCSLVPNYADRRYDSGDLRGAEVAYRQLLDEQSAGPRAERALYRLGVIYLQRESRLYDPAAAAKVLGRLASMKPKSSYTMQAATLLSLHVETQKLRRTIDEQLALRRRTEADLAALRTEATQVEARAKDRAKRVGQLGGEIGRLQTEIAGLREEIAKREDELDRLKAIDLADPP